MPLVLPIVLPDVLPIVPPQTAHALELAPDWLGQQQQGPVTRVPTEMDVGDLRAAFRPERWLDPDHK